MNERNDLKVYKSESKFDKGNLFWGIFFIVAAVFLIIGKLDIFSGFSVMKLIITVFLAAWFLQSIGKRDFGGILFSLAFLCILYDNFLGIESLTPWTVLGAAAFGSIGLSFIFKKNPQHIFYQRPEHINTVENIENGIFVFSNSFGESVKYVNSSDFTQATINNSFGDSKIFFDDAMIPSGQAYININVKFGSTELFFPKTWNVINQATASLGDIKENNHNSSTGSPTIILSGQVAFGSVTITYV